MFDIAGTVELGKICPGTGTWNRLQDGKVCMLEVVVSAHMLITLYALVPACREPCVCRLACIPAFLHVQPPSKFPVPL